MQAWGNAMDTIKKLARVSAVIVLPALALFATQSPAQTSAHTWPQRVVKWMVPLGPGSGADVTARLLADGLSSRWRRPVVVENRPGVDGIVGLTAFLVGSDDHVLLFT